MPPMMIKARTAAPTETPAISEGVARVEDGAGDQRDVGSVLVIVISWPFTVVAISVVKTESGAEEDGTNGLSGDVGVGETVDVVSLGWEVWGGSLEVDGAGSDVGGASDFGGGCELVASGAEVGGVVGSELGCDEDDDGKLDWEVGGSVGGTEVVGGELDVVGGGSEEDVLRSDVGGFALRLNSASGFSRAC